MPPCSTNGAGRIVLGSKTVEDHNVGSKQESTFLHVNIVQWFMNHVCKPTTLPKFTVRFTIVSFYLSTLKDFITPTSSPSRHICTKVYLVPHSYFAFCARKLPLDLLNSGAISISNYMRFATWSSEVVDSSCFNVLGSICFMHYWIRQLRISLTLLNASAIQLRNVDVAAIQELRSIAYPADPLACQLPICFRQHKQGGRKLHVFLTVIYPCHFHEFYVACCSYVELLQFDYTCLWDTTMMHQQLSNSSCNSYTHMWSLMSTQIN